MSKLYAENTNLLKVSFELGSITQIQNILIFSNNIERNILIFLTTAKNLASKMLIRVICSSLSNKSNYIVFIYFQRNILNISNISIPIVFLKTAFNP